MRDFPPPESQSFSPWREEIAPRRVLLVRLHAFGDVAVTLPASRGLRDRFPQAQVDFLTLPVHAPLLRSTLMFDNVLEISPATNPYGRLLNAVRCGIRMRLRRYDVTVDLQRNWMTRIIRRIASPRDWGEFDRFSPKPASERVLEAFVNSGFTGLRPRPVLALPPEVREEAFRLLRDQGYDERRKLIVLNPAGAWKTRNWPVDRYVELARLWLKIESVQFLFLGTGRILDKSAAISNRLGGNVIDLVGRTRPELAMGILQRATVVITEDSGLMHLAWATGVPVVALFGSSRHVWSAPTGPMVRVFHSGDLPCGQCMEADCERGDVHCLTRRSAEEVLHGALELLSRNAGVTA